MFNRFNGNVVPFASGATGTNRTIFGDITQSDNIDDNLNADFKLGWEIVGVNDNPTKQDFNALAFTISNLVAYLYQQGVAEWNTSQEYLTNSYVVGSDGKLYRAKTGTTGTPNVGNNPTTDSTNWENLDSKFVDLLNAQTIAGIKTFSSFPVTPSSVPTTDYQVANKKYVDNKTASSGVDNAIARFNGTSGAIQTSLVKINDEGDIALGDSSFENWYAGYNYLEAGNGSFYGRPEGNSAFGFANNAYYSSVGTWKYKAGLEACVLETSGGNFSFKIAGVGTPDADISFSTLLQLRSSGATVYGNIYADNMFGQSQSWINVTASRSNNVTYTNTTGRPIMFSVRTNQAAYAVPIMFVDGISVMLAPFEATNGAAGGWALVPAGSTYKCNATPSIATWYEYR